MVWGVWCVVSTVYTSFVLWCASQWCVCCVAVCDDSACLVLSHCVVGCGMAVVRGVCGLVACLPLLSVFFSLLLLVFGVVRAQPCEHARYPRTPLCLRTLLLFLFLSAPRLSSTLFHSPPFLLLWNGGGGFTMCQCAWLA